MSNIKLENLEINGYHIYQDKDSFNFGIDAVLLANFALRAGSQCSPLQRNKGSASIRPYEGGIRPYEGGIRPYEGGIRPYEGGIRPYEGGIRPYEGDIRPYEGGIRPYDSVLKICDFCTGALPVPLIMYAKRKMFLGDSVKFTAFEIDREQVELCKKSIAYNKENVEDAKSIDDDIRVINDDIKNIFNDRENYKSMYESFDMITCNPPYTKKGSGIINLNDKKIVARHEVFITFEEICRAASLLLRSNKKFYIVHHSERLTELSEILKSNSFEIKKIQFVYPKLDKPSTLCLIEAVKNAKQGVRILEPIIIFENDGSYTEKVQKIYGK